MFRYLVAFSSFLFPVISAHAAIDSQKVISKSIQTKLLQAHRSRDLDVSYECLENTFNLWSDNELMLAPPINPVTLAALCTTSPCDFSTLNYDDDGLISEYSDRCTADGNNTVMEVTIKFTEEFSNYYSGPVRNLGAPFYLQVDNFPFCISKTCDASQLASFLQGYYGSRLMGALEFLIHDDSSMSVGCIEKLFESDLFYTDDYPFDICESQYPCDALNVTDPELFTNFTDACTENDGRIEFFHLEYVVYYEEGGVYPEVENYPMCLPMECDAQHTASFLHGALFGPAIEVSSSAAITEETSSGTSASTTGTFMTSFLVALGAFMFL